MHDIRVTSVSEPIARSPRLTRLSFGLLSRAQVMGFLPAGLAAAVVLDPALLARIGDEIAAAGVGMAVVPQLRRRGGDLEAALEATIDAIDASPRPEGEWEPARAILGDDLLALLLGGVSASSLRRYASGARQTPDDVAWRLHVVARLLASLLGSYNAYGIRRWFERPRSALAGRTPASALRSARREDDRRLQTTLALAAALEGPALAA